MSKFRGWMQNNKRTGERGGFQGIREEKFSFRYGKFEMPVGHPNGDVFVLCDAKLSGEVWADLLFGNRFSGVNQHCPEQ